MIPACLFAALLCLLLAASPGCVARTPKDDMKMLERGSTKVFEGIISGDLSTVKEGVQDGGSLVHPLDPFIGEVVLKLGEAHISFPVVPPLHMAFNYGRKEHIAIANYIISLGADVNAFQLPDPDQTEEALGRGYAPAVLYALGLGQQPNGSHAVMVERLHKSFPEKFSIPRLYDWIMQTGNPPLTHMCILLDNFDCLYLALAEFSLPVDERDDFGMTALHVAAWNGDIQSAIMLLHNGADLLAVDASDRSPLFIATVRRNLDMMALLLGQALTNKSFGKGTLDRLKTMLFTKDKFSKDVVDLIMQGPTFPRAVAVVQHFIVEAGGSFEHFISEGSHRNYMWHVLLESNVLPEVEAVSSTMISRDSFFSSYHSCLRPVVFVDQLTRGFGIWAYNTVDNLCQRFSHLQLQRSPLQYPPARDLADVLVGGTVARDSMHTLHDVLQASAESGLPFTMQVTIDPNQYEQGFNYDFRRPDVFSICGDNDQEPFIATFTPARGGLKLHSHNSSWNLLLTGKKTWFFIPPEVLRNVSLREHVDQTLGATNALFELAPDRFLAEVYPLLVAQQAVFSFVQHPEEVMYIPHMWSHITFAHEDSISISQHFCALINTDTRMHPVGWILYGGRDEHRGLGAYKAHVTSNTHLFEERQVSNKRRRPAFEFAQST